MSSENVVFLYSRMAGYFYYCIEEFTNTFQCHAHIIHQKPSNEAPFEWKSKTNITFYDREELSTKEIVLFLVEKKPEAVYVVNWIDKGYLKALHEYKRKYRRDLVIVAGFDPPWRGRFKQYVAQYLAFPVVKYLFTYAWVAGIEQYEYARKLGFSSKNIFLDLYSANTSEFNKVYHNSIQEKENVYPKQLLFVGRLIEWKGIKDLYEVFNSLTDEDRNGWILHIVGEGYFKKEIKENDQTKLSGFIQPDELPKIVKNSGAFCLPSWDEHWGVVVQEFAAGGLPLVISDKVSSSTAFLIPGYNGFEFKAKNRQSLKNALIRLFALTDDKLLEQGKHSFELSQKITPKQWAYNLHHMTTSGD